MIPHTLIMKRSIKTLCVLLLNIFFIHMYGYCQYTTPYEVGGLTPYPMGVDASKLFIESEVVEIDIQDYGVYHNTSTYIIRNNGKKVEQKLGFYLIRPYGDNVSELDVPKDVLFVVNDRKVPCTDDTAVVEEIRRKIEHFYYIDVVFPENESTKITLGYTSNPQTIACVEGNVRSGIIPGLNRGNPYTLSIEIENDNYYRISDIFFASEKWYHLMDDLSGLSTNVGDSFSIYKLGGKKWMLKFNDRFVRKYGDDFFINVAGNDPEYPFFVFYPDGIEDRLSGVWLRSNSDSENGNLSKRKLAKYELLFYTNNQLRLLRNCFYARYGYMFKDKKLYDYFMSLNGTPMVGGHAVYKVNPQFTETVFNDIERENIRIIRQLEAMPDEAAK